MTPPPTPQPPPMPEPCRLKDGCCLLAHGTVCGEVCWARITER